MNPLPERHGWRARCSRRSPAHSEQTQLAPMLGHANHSFGIAILREHFPDARAVATTGTCSGTWRRQAGPDMLPFWQGRFPGQ